MGKSLFSENEPNYRGSLVNLVRLLKTHPKLLLQIQRERQYYDEPKFWYFSASVNANFLRGDSVDFSSSASGCSFFSKDVALLKCLAESIERYCNYYYSDKFGTSAYFRDVIDKTIPLMDFARYSTAQLKNKSYSRFRFSPGSKLHWTQVIHLLSDKRLLVPSNFIYLSYPYSQNEPLIYPPISTGVAGGSSLSGALLRGVYETLERDAFMISYLNKLPSPKIKLEKVADSRIKFFVKIARQYKLEIICLDITTDIKIPIVATIIIDQTGIGKPVSIGLKCDLDPISAIIGSITEAFHTRGWIRHAHEQKEATSNKNRQSLIQRGLFWYDTGKISKLNFWLQNNNYSNIHSINNPLSTGQELKSIVQELSSRGCDVYWKDLTLKVFQPYYRVVKVIIPQLQPLTFDEKHPLLGGKRLHEVPKLLGYKTRSFNAYPHPFL